MASNHYAGLGKETSDLFSAEMDRQKAERTRSARVSLVFKAAAAGILAIGIWKAAAGLDSLMVHENPSSVSTKSSK